MQYRSANGARQAYVSPLFHYIFSSPIDCRKQTDRTAEKEAKHNAKLFSDKKYKSTRESPILRREEKGNTVSLLLSLSSVK